MSADLIDACNGRRQTEGGVYSSLEETVRPFLLEMLARLRSQLDTPLSADTDSVGIVRAAWQQCFAGAADVASPGRDPDTIVGALESLIHRALGEESGHRRDEPAQLCGGPRSPVGDCATQVAAWLDQFQLAAWLDRLQTALRRIHPRAVELVGLRLEGVANREIAQRFDWGLRLVQRILHDVRLAWAGAAEKR
ncbi:MAG: hypothetical protein IT429_22165 [Gemmataceae bacterium]|nr:hypothetical protein [Gemmataceae bacterium]